MSDVSNWNTLLLKVAFDHNATMTLHHSASMTYMMWCQEHIWNVSVLQKVQLFKFVKCKVCGEDGHLNNSNDISNWRCSCR